jgi:hypothetical protein
VIQPPSKLALGMAELTPWLKWEWSATTMWHKGVAPTILFIFFYFLFLKKPQFFFLKKYGCHMSQF